MAPKGSTQQPAHSAKEAQHRATRPASGSLRSVFGKLLCLQLAILCLGLAGLGLLPALPGTQPTVQVAGLVLPLHAVWSAGILLACSALCALLLAASYRQLQRETKRLLDAEGQAQRHAAHSGSSAMPASSADHETTLRELELARAQAQHASRLKSELIAKASHELLTPLNSISGFAGILQRETLDPAERLEYIDLIADNAQQLETLVNDLISFADRRSDAIRIVYRRVDVGELLSSVARSFKEILREHGLAMETGIDGVRGIEIETDAARLRQMLSNLVVNAVRNTEQGSIALRARLDESSAASAYLVIDVEDSGCGIEPSRLEQLRKALYSGGGGSGGGGGVQIRRRDSADEPADDQLELPQSRTPGLGFGLGLPIVADLADRLGARLEVESEAGRGSRFTIAVPARDWRRRSTAQDAPADIASDLAASLPTRRAQGVEPAVAPALVVDDRESNRRLLQHLMRNAGYQCDIAASGAEALAMIDERNYDWLFIDIGMHPMDGPALLQETRGRSGYLNVPCIACTALRQNEDARRFREMGFDALLTKPIDPQQIPLLAARFKLPAPRQTSSQTSSQRAKVPDKQAASPGATKANHKRPDTPPVFDIAGAIAHTSGDREFARRLAETLRIELEEALQAQQRGFDSEDERLRHYHALNASASLGGTPELSALLNRYEALLRADHRDNDEATQRQAGIVLGAIEQVQRELLDWFSQIDLEKAFAESA